MYINICFYFQASTKLGNSSYSSVLIVRARYKETELDVFRESVEEQIKDVNRTRFKHTDLRALRESLEEKIKYVS